MLGQTPRADGARIKSKWKRYMLEVRTVEELK